MLDERLTPDGVNLAQSNRPAGWQDVFHFHLHVIPRSAGDGLVPPWRPTRPQRKNSLQNSGDFDRRQCVFRLSLAAAGVRMPSGRSENAISALTSPGLGIRAGRAAHCVALATAAEGVARLRDAHAAGRLNVELTRLGRVPLLVIDEVGYIPFDGEAANLFFQLISARYERASTIVTSNQPFGRWGESSATPLSPPP